MKHLVPFEKYQASPKATLSVKRTRSKPVLDELYYFELEARVIVAKDSIVTKADIKYVSYVLDETFGEYKIQRSSDQANDFRLRFWTFGFFEIRAILTTWYGRRFELEPHKIQFEVEDEHRRVNGADEFRW
jgi:hypothetical protein